MMSYWNKMGYIRSTVTPKISFSFFLLLLFCLFFVLFSL